MKEREARGSETAPFVYCPFEACLMLHSERRINDPPELPQMDRVCSVLLNPSLFFCSDLQHLPNTLCEVHNNVFLK